MHRFQPANFFAVLPSEFTYAKGAQRAPFSFATVGELT